MRHKINRTLRRSSSQGFTLVELLVVLGIIALLIGILFPVLRSVRRSGRNIQCANNMRQLSIALIAYANEFKGSFPANSGALQQYWFQSSVLGRYISTPDRVGDGNGLAGGVLVCPNDLSDAIRSYSMNVFASGSVSVTVEKALSRDDPPGRLFKLGDGSESSHLLLLLESWPEAPVPKSDPLKFSALPMIGLTGRPGERFGGGNGLLWTGIKSQPAGRFDIRPSQITFYRHAPQFKQMEEPKGQANFAFVDGHVALLRHDELVGRDGVSTYLAIWSPLDRQVESGPHAAP